LKLHDCSTCLRQLSALVVALTVATACSNPSRVGDGDAGGHGDGAIGEGAAGGSDLDSVPDPFESLPTLTPDGDGATVGPEGGHIDFPDGFALDVPAGALAESTTIHGHLAPDAEPAPAGFIRVAPDIEFLPEGLLFAKQARLSVPMPILPGGTPISIDDLVVYSLSAGESEPADGTVIELSPTQGLYASIAHFSRVVFYRVGNGDTVGGLFGKTCETSALSGLSDQIRQVLLETDSLLLKRVISPWLVPSTVAPSGREVWLQAGAADDLLAALAEGTRQKAPKLVYNAHWRSVADQLLLTQPGCTNNKVAKVAESNHLDGTAIDVQGQAPMADTCAKLAKSTNKNWEKVLAGLHAPWGPILSRHNFEWYGVSQGSCADPPHFDHVGDTALEARASNMFAFQELWNRNRPCQAISASEIALVKAADLSKLTEAGLPQTFAAIKASPAGGFPSVVQVSIPAEGSEDLGCGTKGQGSARTTCCPAPPGGGPSCANLLGDREHCGACNIRCSASDECSAGSCGSCDAPTSQCASSSSVTATTYRHDPVSHLCEATRITLPCPADEPPQCVAGGVATTTYSCEDASGQCRPTVRTLPCAIPPPPVCDGNDVVIVTYACNPSSGDCEQLRKATPCLGGATCHDGSCQCASDETACGAACCPGRHACADAAANACDPCELNETACGRACCAAGSTCVNPDTGTCQECQAGETACGATCCPVGHACSDSATGSCDPCTVVETACGAACCGPGSACSDPAAGLCDSCLSSPLGAYASCVGTCGCAPKVGMPRITLTQAINECGDATSATVTSAGVQAWGESAQLSADGTLLNWADGSTWVRECNPAR
jgi:hypothetical protein